MCENLYEDDVKDFADSLDTSSLQWKVSEEVTRVLPDFVKKARSKQSAFAWLHEAFETYYISFHV